MGPIRCPETSVNNCYTTPRNIPEERRPQLKSALKSRRYKGETLQKLFHKSFFRNSKFDVTWTQRYGRSPQKTFNSTKIKIRNNKCMFEVNNRSMAVEIQH
jgi:hypothetical protein